MKHVVIDGRVYRVVNIEAGETRDAARHISAQRPIGATQAAELRKAVSR